MALMSYLLYCRPTSARSIHYGDARLYHIIPVFYALYSQYLFALHTQSLIICSRHTPTYASVSTPAIHRQFQGVIVFAGFIPLCNPHHLHLHWLPLSEYDS